MIRKIKFNKKISLLFLSSILIINTSFAIFYDIKKEDSNYYEAIKFVSENNILNGIGENLFAPNEVMTRAMLVQALYNMENHPIVETKNKYEDVVSGKWYENAIIWSAENGLINNISDNKFEPNKEIIKEDMIEILYNYIKYKKYDVVIEENTNLDSKQVLTRGEAAQIIKEFCDYYPMTDMGWIELNGNPTTGYIWVAKDYDEEIIKVFDYIYSPNNFNLVGNLGKFRFNIRALKQGNTKIVFNYMRPWEENAVNTVICEIEVDSNNEIHITRTVE